MFPTIFIFKSSIYCKVYKRNVTESVKSKRWSEVYFMLKNYASKKAKNVETEGSVSNLSWARTGLVRLANYDTFHHLSKSR